MILLRDIKNLFEHEEKEKNHYKSVRLRNFWSNNYIEYKSNSDRNKTLSIEECLDTIRPYLKYIINNLKSLSRKSSINNRGVKFIFLIDNDKERKIHSNSDNKEIMINDKADEVIKELFYSLKNRYQNNLESMRGSQFVSV